MRERKAAEAARGQTEEAEQIEGDIMTRDEEEEEVEEWSDMEGVKREGLYAPRHAAATKTGRAQLHRAAEGGHAAAARISAESGADAAAVDGEGRPPLVQASGEGREDVARLLVGNDADAAAEDGDDWTPLLPASHLGHGAVVCSIWTVAPPGRTLPSPLAFAIVCRRNCVQARQFLTLTHGWWTPSYLALRAISEFLN